MNESSAEGRVGSEMGREVELGRNESGGASIVAAMKYTAIGAVLTEDGTMPQSWGGHRAITKPVGWQRLVNYFDSDLDALCAEWLSHRERQRTERERDGVMHQLGRAEVLALRDNARVWARLARVWADGVQVLIREGSGVLGFSRGMRNEIVGLVISGGDWPRGDWGCDFAVDHDLDDTGELRGDGYVLRLYAGKDGQA